MSGLDTYIQPFKSVYKNIKAFLRRQRWKEALIFSFFVLLSFGFWLLQSLQQEYEIGINIPVRYKNVPPDVAFSQAMPDMVHVKVKDKGSVLLNYTLGRSFAPIEADMKNKNPEDGSFIIKKKEIENNILKQLIATTTLVNFEPQQIDLKYSKRLNKKLPVQFQGSIQTEAGFLVSGTPKLEPSEVNVYAIETILDTLKYINTVYTEIKKGNKNITRSLQLQKINGATIVPELVTITIPIEEYTEKTLDIPVVCTDLPSHYILRTFPQTIKVNCSIPLSRFKMLSENDFAIQISFADLEQNISGTIPITLSKQPDWVHKTTLSPNEIEFILEQNQTND